MEQVQQLVIGGKDARKMYPTASPEWKATFEATFGKDFFSQKITDRIKTFADACEILGIDSDDAWHESDEQDEVAYKQLKIIARALNEGWEPNYNDGNQRKWYPWFYLNDPGVRLHGVRCDLTRTDVGARLVFKTEELARYAATQFQGLYSDYLQL